MAHRERGFDETRPNPRPHGRPRGSRPRRCPGRNLLQGAADRQARRPDRRGPDPNRHRPLGRHTERQRPDRLRDTERGWKPDAGPVLRWRVPSHRCRGPGRAGRQVAALRRAVVTGEHGSAR